MFVCNELPIDQHLHSEIIVPSFLFLRRLLGLLVLFLDLVVLLLGFGIGLLKLFAPPLCRSEVGPHQIKFCAKTATFFPVFVLGRYNEMLCAMLCDSHSDGAAPIRSIEEC